MKILSNSVEKRLKGLSLKTDTLLSQESLEVLLKGSTSKGKRINEENYNKLVLELPPRIYTSIADVIEVIKHKLKVTADDSTKYSVWTRDHASLKPCKSLSYKSGNVITQRNDEIEQILLTLDKKDKRGVIIVGEPGVGKAQPIDSHVLTNNGWRKIKDLKIGDKVICPDNNESTILGIFPQGEKQVNEITFSDGRSAECCNEHLWKIYSKEWKKRGSDSRITELNLIKEIKEKTRTRLYIDLIKPINGTSNTLDIDPYILGILLGDGSLTKGPQFTKKDQEIIDKVRNKLDENHSLNKCSDKNTFTLSIVSNSNNLYSNKYRNFIKNMGLNVTSEFKYIPYIYLNSSIESKTELLQGLMDTDGTIGKNGNLVYNTSSEQLANDVVYLVQSLGGIAKVSKKIPKFTYKNEKKEGLVAYRIGIRIPNPRKYVTLKRKLDRIPENYQYNNLKLEISSIQEIGKKECACIYIDHPEHLYITDNFIVTHNTAVVRAVNARLIEKTVPRNLISCEIFNMDLPYIFTKYKEDPIGVIIKILETASQDDKCILFIDEVHQLLIQKMNDVLKPYLTEKIRFIGSTTIDEYHSIVTDDRALERRFTIVPINEPGIAQTSKMIIGTKAIFEQHHRCHIPENICNYLVENGSRFMGHRRNPDKSLDILDISCTLLHNSEVHETTVKPEETGDILQDLELDVKEISSTKTNAGNRVLTEDYINKAISHITGVNYNTIRNSLDYSFVVKTISERVLGQSSAIEEMANVVNIIKNINYDQGRPLSVLMVVGPAGCGKLSTCKKLAGLVFGSEDNLIDIDLGSFKSEFQLTELRGAPPGYVGYGKSGVLIKQLRNKPQSIVFFRKANQCHPMILDYLLGGINSGRFIDSAEREVKLNNAIIVFSITMSEEELKRLNKKTMGFSTEKEGVAVDENIDKAIGPSGIELKKVADSYIIFNSLTDELLEKIFDANVEQYLNMYKRIDLDRTELRKNVLAEAKNGHDIISKLASEVPKLIFKSFKGV